VKLASTGQEGDAEQSGGAGRAELTGRRVQALIGGTQLQPEYLSSQAFILDGPRIEIWIKSRGATERAERPRRWQAEMTRGLRRLTLWLGGLVAERGRIRRRRAAGGVGAAALSASDRERRRPPIRMASSQAHTGDSPNSPGGTLILRWRARNQVADRAAGPGSLPAQPLHSCRPSYRSPQRGETTYCTPESSNSPLKVPS
jgi:hypothetical protein